MPQHHSVRCCVRRKRPRPTAGGMHSPQGVDGSHDPDAPSATQTPQEESMEPKIRFTQAQRGFARRTANRMLTQESHEFESDTSNATYTTRVMLDGKLMCDCRGWTIRKRDRPRECKHTREVAGDRE